MYVRDKKKQLEAQRRSKNKKKKALRDFLSAEKSKPCTDCGKSFHPFMMDFDHIRGDKIAGVTAMISKVCTLERLKEEIAKCELVCSNCHRIRTYLSLKGQRLARIDKTVIGLVL